jgi:hypothetical protein
MTHHSFIDALLARGLSVSGLSGAVLLDSPANFQGSRGSVHRSERGSNQTAKELSTVSATPSAWHALLRK